MLIDYTKLLDCPVLSLHVGEMIAKTTALIIDPNNLKIVGFQLVGPEVGGGNGTFLQVKDIREFSDVGMIIDSIDEFVSPGDVVRLDEVLELNFELIDKKVESKKGTKIGKVSGFMVNTKDFAIQQFTVQRPLMKSFLDPELLIGRSEIVKVTDEKIIVKDEEDKIRKKALKEDFVPNFVNPFRAGGAFAPEPGVAATKLEPNLSQIDSQSLDAPNS